MVCGLGVKRPLRCPIDAEQAGTSGRLAFGRGCMRLCAVIGNGNLDPAGVLDRFESCDGNGRVSSHAGTGCLSSDAPYRTRKILELRKQGHLSVQGNRHENTPVRPPISPHRRLPTELRPSPFTWSRTRPLPTRANAAVRWWYHRISYTALLIGRRRSVGEWYRVHSPNLSVGK